MDSLSLEVEPFGLGLCKFQALKISAHEACYKVESVILVELAETIDTYSLLVIEAEKVQLLPMETAVDWYGLLWPCRLRRNVAVKIQVVYLIIDVHVLLSHDLLREHALAIVERASAADLAYHHSVRALPQVGGARIRCVTGTATLLLVLGVPPVNWVQTHDLIMIGAQRDHLLLLERGLGKLLKLSRSSKVLLDLNPLS
jgi:hypothetical protein